MPEFTNTTAYPITWSPPFPAEDGTWRTQIVAPGETVEWSNEDELGAPLEVPTIAEAAAASAETDPAPAGDPEEK